MKTKLYCPHCGKPINPGVMLGSLNVGVKKRLTEEQKQVMRDNLNRIRHTRWPLEKRTLTREKYLKQLEKEVA